MLRRITTFNFKTLPGALLICIVCVVAAESVIYINRAHLIKDFWNKFLINEHVLIDQKSDAEYLIVGDSIQKTGLQPNEIDGSVLNLGLPGGKPMGLYLLFKRYLKDHPAPKAIFVYIDPEDPRDSLNVILRYFVSFPEVFGIWRDLTWSQRAVFIMRYWASLDLRKVGLTSRAFYPKSNKAFIADMLSNKGYMPTPSADRALGPGFFARNTERVTRNITISDVDMKYLDKLVQLAASKGIIVVFLGFLLPEELYDILDATGFNNEYIAFYEGLKKRYPDCRFVDQPLLFLGNDFFGDMSHVNNRGSAAYTEYFKSQVFEKYKK